MRSLHEDDERLRLAIDAGQLGIWDWDIVHNRVTWSDRVYELHGVRPGEFGGRVEDFAALVHPEDAPAVQAATGATFAAATARRDDGRVEVG